MTELDNKLITLKDELYSEPVVKEYFRLKSLISNDKALMLLDENIKKLQRDICNNIHSDVNTNDSKKLALMLEEFNSNPVIINYNKIELEVRDLLEEISKILEK